MVTSVKYCDERSLDASYLSNTKLFPYLHSLINTREGLGEFDTVITFENSPYPSSVYIRLFNCIYKTTEMLHTIGTAPFWFYKHIQTHLSANQSARNILVIS